MSESGLERWVAEAEVKVKATIENPASLDHHHPSDDHSDHSDHSDIISDNSAIIISTVDGVIYTLDAFNGNLRGMVQSGGPLVSTIHGQHHVNGNGNGMGMAMGIMSVPAWRITKMIMIMIMIMEKNMNMRMKINMRSYRVSMGHSTPTHTTI